MTVKRKYQVIYTGFTIIETLFVLAIAGLILLLVFEAIPTLTRNARNDRRKQDVADILQAVSHYQLNHSGDFPDPTSNFLQYSNLSFYDKTTVSYVAPTPVNGIGVYGYAAAAASPVNAPAVPLNENNVEIRDYQKCSTTSPGDSTNQGAGFNDIVALYAIETRGGIDPRCTEI